MFAKTGLNSHDAQNVFPWHTVFLRCLSQCCLVSPAKGDRPPDPFLAKKFGPIPGPAPRRKGLFTALITTCKVVEGPILPLCLGKKPQQVFPLKPVFIDHLLNEAFKLDITCKISTESIAVIAAHTGFPCQSHALPGTK